MMGKLENGLQKIGEKYYFHKKVPVKLRKKIGLSAIKRCLGTDSKSTSTIWAIKLNEVFDLIFEEAKRPVSLYDDYTPEEMKKLILVEFFKIVDAKKIKPVLEGHFENVSMRFYSIKHYFEKFFTEKEKTVKGATLEQTLAAFKFFFKDGSMKLEEINKGYIESIFRSKKVSDTTCYSYTTKLLHFLKWIENTEGFTFDKDLKHSIRLFSKTLNNTSERDAFTNDMIKKIFSENYSKTFGRSPAYYFTYLLCYLCGLRTSEASNLKIKNIHEEKICGESRYYLQIEAGKTKAARRVIVIPDIVKSLGFKEYYDQRNQEAVPEAPLWNDRKAGRGSYTTSFDKYLEAIGIRDGINKDNPINLKYTINSLRHAHATKLISSRVSVDYSNRVFGHAGKNLMADRYFIQQPELEDLYTQVTAKLDFSEELAKLKPFGLSLEDIKKSLEYLVKHWNTSSIINKIISEYEETNNKSFSETSNEEIAYTKEDIEAIRTYYAICLAKHDIKSKSIEEVSEQLYTLTEFSRLKKQCKLVDENSTEYDFRLLSIVWALQNKNKNDCFDKDYETAKSIEEAF